MLLDITARNMKFAVLLSCLIWSLPAVLGAGPGVVAQYNEFHFVSSKNVDNQRFLNCTCMDKVNVHKAIPILSSMEIMKVAFSSDPCQESFLTEICELLKKCHNCTAAVKSCERDETNGTQYQCIQRSLVMEQSDDLPDPAGASEVEFTSYETNTLNEGSLINNQSDDLSASSEAFESEFTNSETETPNEGAFEAEFTNSETETPNEGTFEAEFRNYESDTLNEGNPIMNQSDDLPASSGPFEAEFTNYKTDTLNEEVTKQEIPTPETSPPSTRSRRKRRAVSSCHIPPDLNKLKASSLNCEFKDDQVDCKQHCIHGYTLKESRSKKVTCNYKKGIWKPEFEKCKPITNCFLALVSDGMLNCYHRKKSDNPVCQISCSPDAENRKVRINLYTCRFDGTWSEPLPFCVARVSGTSLISQSNKGITSSLSIDPYVSILKG